MTQTHAALYCRISRDPDGTSLGVNRQRKDCEALARRKGWAVADVYIDDDVSAFSGKRRPEYERMMSDLRDHRVGAVVAWHPDRLHRSPRELEDFIEAIEGAGAQIATCTAGDIDLATPDGRLMARIVGSVARKESEDKSRRLRRKHVEIAENGAVSGGGRRPFGYNKDRLTIRESEAKEIRAAAQRVLAGESVRSITADWRARGIKSVTGAAWSPTTVRRLLKSGRIAGQREHHGEIVGPAVWPAIIDPDDSVRLRAILTDPARQRGQLVTTRTYLLTGFVFCADCLAKAERDGRKAPHMMSQARVQTKAGKKYRYPRYVCATDRGGCGRCGIGAGPLEQDIAEVLFARLDSPRLAKTVERKRSKKAPKPAVVDIADLEGRQAELLEMFAAGEITRAELKASRDSIANRIAAAKAKVTEESVIERTSPYIGRGGVLRAEWDDLTIDQKRAILAGFIDRIEIDLTTKADNKYNPDRVHIVWKR